MLAIKIIMMFAIWICILTAFNGIVDLMGTKSKCKYCGSSEKEDYGHYDGEKTRCKNCKK